MAMLNNQRVNQIRGEIATARIKLDIFEEPSSAHLPSLNPQYLVGGFNFSEKH